MFERYTEEARRVIFAARDEAIQDGDSHIRLIHLLAGLEREIPEILRQAGLSRQLLAGLRASGEFAKRGPKHLAASVELPLDAPTKDALRMAADFAEQFHSRRVSRVHLLFAVSQADAKLKGHLLEGGLKEERLRSLAEQSGEREPTTSAEWAPVDPGLGARQRSGIGYDLHRLEPGRKLVLGGITLPFDRGPIGHSDGDALSHAICDALLGASGLGDIGTHFPDTDPKWQGVSSLVFLEQVRQLLEERGLSVVHIDAIVIAERPRLGPHFPAMREALARALGISAEQINLKAKTHEGLGELGRSEAIAAQAIATLAEIAA
jgi:2-C-methyl-D-erythritol 2,4-cyclodiphosphate synthase